MTDAYLEKEVNNTILKLKEGKIILYPTDTIWGIGCSVKDSNAVKRIFSIKQRPEEKKLILLVADMEMLKEYVTNIPDEVIRLINKAKEPLTVIYTQVKNLPDDLLGPNNTIAIRIPDDLFCKVLIKELGHPITSTSANIFNSPIPGSFQEIQKGILKGVDYIVNLRQSEPTLKRASKIVRFNKGILYYLRN